MTGGYPGCCWPSNAGGGGCCGWAKVGLYPSKGCGLEKDIILLGPSVLDPSALLLGRR